MLHATYLVIAKLMYSSEGLPVPNITSFRVTDMDAQLAYNNCYLNYTDV